MVHGGAVAARGGVGGDLRARGRGRGRGGGQARGHRSRDRVWRGGRTWPMARRPANSAATRSRRWGGCDMLIHNASGFGVGRGRGTTGCAVSQVDMMAGVRAVEECEAALEGERSGQHHPSSAPWPANIISADRPAMVRPRGRCASMPTSWRRSWDPSASAPMSSPPGAVWFPGGSWDKRKEESPKFYAAVEKAIPLGSPGHGRGNWPRVIAFVASPAGRVDQRCGPRGRRRGPGGGGGLN